MRACTYLKKLKAIPNVNPEAALEKMLTEQWAYDDISEYEDDEEDDKTSSFVELDRAFDETYEYQRESALNHADINESFDSQESSPMLLSSTRGMNDGSSTDDDTDDDKESPNIISSPAEILLEPHNVGQEAPLSSQESISVLFRDQSLCQRRHGTVFFSTLLAKVGISF